MPGIKRSDHDDYIASFPQIQQNKLQQCRSIIRDTLPWAEEVISYNIPAFTINGTPVMYYSGHKVHTSLSFYPTETTYKQFKKELTNFKHSKSAIQFPLDKPLPEKLIHNIVVHGVQVKLAFIEAKKKKNLHVDNYTISW